MLSHRCGCSDWLRSFDSWRRQCEDCWWTTCLDGRQRVDAEQCDFDPCWPVGWWWHVKSFWIMGGILSTKYRRWWWLSIICLCWWEWWCFPHFRWHPWVFAHRCVTVRRQVQWCDIFRHVQEGDSVAKPSFFGLRWWSRAPNIPRHYHPWPEASI